MLYFLFHLHSFAISFCVAIFRPFFLAMHTFFVPTATQFHYHGLLASSPPYTPSSHFIPLYFPRPLSTHRDISRFLDFSNSDFDVHDEKGYVSRLILIYRRCFIISYNLHVFFFFFTISLTFSSISCNFAFHRLFSKYFYQLVCHFILHSFKICINYICVKLFIFYCKYK